MYKYSHFAVIDLSLFFGIFFGIPCLKTRLEMQKALEEDSTVYDYDAVYDDIQTQRLENNKKVLHGTDKRVIMFMLTMSIAAFVDTGWFFFFFRSDLIFLCLLSVSLFYSQSISTS